MSKKHIYIINTGGTISSAKTKNGFEPKSGYVRKQLASLPEFKHPELPDFTVHSYEPLLDSANINAENWNQIAQDIAENYDRYDGFLILHGTDTMAYTASALSFMLENLGKPVILTGSQLPLSELRSDARDNLINALLFASMSDIPEVCIYFGDVLLRGNRAQKVSATQFTAFDSPNFPQLAVGGTELKVDQHYVLPASKNNFTIQLVQDAFIANFRLFPGASTEVLANILQQPLQGLILETYGSGNAQTNDAYFLEILQQATNRGTIIVNCTQCQKGSVNMSTYATGSALQKIGLLSGYDMTPEAAHCKMLYLLSKLNNAADIRLHLEKNLRGELSKTQ